MVDQKLIKEKKEQHIYSVDIIRVILALLIVTFHIFDKLSSFWEFNAPGYIAVEAFFIISGYFLVRSIYKKNNPPPVHIYIFRKIWFFVPIIIIVFLIALIAFGITSGIYRAPWVEVLSLPMSALWYIGFMILASLILYPIYKHAKNKFAFPAIVIAIAFYLVFYFTLGYIDNLDIKGSSEDLIALIFIGRCFMRSVAGEVLGGFIYASSTKIKKIKNNKPLNITFSTIGILCGLSGLSIAILFPKTPWDFFVILMFFIFFFILLTDIGIISKKIIFSDKISIFLSNFSLFLYLTHRIAICFLWVFSATWPELLDQNWWIGIYILLSYVMSILLAIGVERLYALIKGKLLVKFKKLNNI